jgi:hypothetical protein
MRNQNSVHRLELEILEKGTFRKLGLFPSSGEGEYTQFGRNLNH